MAELNVVVESAVESVVYGGWCDRCLLPSTRTVVFRVWTTHRTPVGEIVQTSLRRIDHCLDCGDRRLAPVVEDLDAELAGLAR